MKKYDIELLPENKLRFTFKDPDFYVVVTDIKFPDEGDELEIEYNSEEDIVGDRLEILQLAVCDFIQQAVTELAEDFVGDLDLDVDGA